MKKPDPRIFNEVLSSLRLAPKDCVYVGDTWEDVVCAREAGLRSIIVDRGSDASQPLDFQLPGSSTLEEVREGEEVEVVRRLRDLVPLLT